ncbi:MAG: phosphoribosylaminoimidazolesuccinocarboxamide synthase [Gammaproteobacteria bacterium RIFCSPHIGHO2_12_FULL_42_10]|nr:MAG: phosphoribosylaminoimidazolesuccinocarboxamide synthase [Gammaproteobacteria bacterium RIFCSPHIGHO2_12_FULL_42_10]
MSTLQETKQDRIRAAIPFCLSETTFDFGKKYRGKVRDTYDLGDRLMIVTTDRLTAFDRSLALIPYKGQVLNLTSAWWFEQTSAIVPNHLITIPDPNVMIVKKCTVFPIEFVVRGFIAGSTDTSLWTQYAKGVRDYCGVHFREGLKKNTVLDHPVLTPTTKETEHDRPIAPKEIISEGWMSAKDWEIASNMALQLFQFGSKVAGEHGLILVDTKYEFGKTADGQIVLVDEIHTPDSSRYWLRASYDERMQNGQSPDHIDKEFMRLWFRDHCDPYRDAVLPVAPESLVVTLAERYIQLYETITGNTFVYDQGVFDVAKRIQKHVVGYV